MGCFLKTYLKQCVYTLYRVSSSCRHVVHDKNGSLNALKHDISTPPLRIPPYVSKFYNSGGALCVCSGNNRYIEDAEAWIINPRYTVSFGCRTVIRPTVTAFMNLDDIIIIIYFESDKISKEVESA